MVAYFCLHLPDMTSCQIVKLTCQIFMSSRQIVKLTCQIFMSSRQIVKLTCQILMSSCQIVKLTCQILMSSCHIRYIDLSFINFLENHVIANFTPMVANFCHRLVRSLCWLVYGGMCKLTKTPHPVDFLTFVSTYLHIFINIFFTVSTKYETIQ